MESSPIRTIADAIAAAQPAYDTLAELAEDVEDEWSYINDLATAWRDRFDEVAAARSDEQVGDDVAAAIDAVAGEAAAVDDPHRAIDWLSTYPQVVLIALGERP
ncbi:MAG: hypothetical protein H0U52_15635 [Chloroflexi bacterium]|nr:hypothetical protein [Chloroflexota bacterium]